MKRNNTGKEKEFTEKDFAILIMLGLLIASMFFTFVQKQKIDKITKENFVIPKSAGVFTSLNENVGIVVFDLEDKEQSYVYTQTNLFFKQLSQRKLFGR